MNGPTRKTKADTTPEPTAPPCVEPAKSVTRVAGYVRTSTKRQDLESQSAAVTAWAERAGHVVVMHSDDATTGRKADREGIEGLVAAAERREFTLVAVTELSRIGRSIGFIHKTVERLSELGIKVVLVNTGTILDYTTLEGRALIGALALAADVEWMLIRERNERGRATIKSRGVKVGRKAVDISEAVLRALRERRMSVREIATEVHASAATVGRRLKALGLGDRPA